MGRSHRARKAKKVVRRNRTFAAAFGSGSYRRLTLDPLESRILLAADMNVRFEVDAPVPVSTLSVGENFTLKVFVQDTRATPQGVLQAYYNLAYDSSVAAVTGPVVNGPDFNIMASGDDSTAGVIKTAGGLSTTQVPPTPGNLEQLLFSVPMKIVGAGQFTLIPSLGASVNPIDTVQLFGSSAEPLSAMSFTGLPLAVNSGPAVAFMNAADSTPTNATNLHYTVTFNEPVSGVDASDFSLAKSGITGSSITSVSPSSGFNTSYAVTVNSGSLTAGTGTLALNLIDGDVITDIANNTLAGGHTNRTLFTGQSYTIDRTAPTVNSITTSGANLTNAASVQYTVTFNKSVTGVAASDFSLLASGITGASINSISGSGTTYTVTVHTGSGDGTLTLNLIDGPAKISDAVGNTLAGGNSGGLLFAGQSYTIRKTSPAATAISTKSANPTNAASVHYAVTFNEAVSGVSANDFKLVSAGIAGASISSVTGSGTSWIVNVATGTGNGTLGLSLVDGIAKISDTAGNFIGGGNTGETLFTGSSAYTIDKTPPAVSSIAASDATPTAAATVHFTLTFSESVAGIVAGDFELVQRGVSGAAITDVRGSGTTWTVTATTGTGNGTLGLNLVDGAAPVTDAAGNILSGGDSGNTIFTGDTYTLDRTLPTVVSLVPDGTTPTNQASVAFTVTFSESVAGVDVTDFAPVMSGITGAAVTGVSGSGARYTVTLSTGSGSGTLALNVVDGHPITDQTGKGLGGGNTGKLIFAGTSPYTIDKTPVSVSSIEPAASSPTNATSADFTITFNKSVNGVDRADFALDARGITGASITGVSGSGMNWKVTASTGTGDGTLGLNLIDGASAISDAAGNVLAGGGTGAVLVTGTPVYTVDKAAPTVVSIALTDASSVSAPATVHFTVTFSEVVTSLNASDFALASSGLTGAAITSVSGSGTTWTVTASTGAGSGTLGLKLIDGDAITDAVGNKLSGGQTGNTIFSSPASYNVQTPAVQSVGSGTELFVAQVYRDLLKREPEPQDLQFWTNLIDGGLSRQTAVAQIESSAEFRADVVQGLYQLYLHRAAEPAVVTSLSNFLLHGTPEQIAIMLASSNEYFQSRGGGTSSGYLTALFNDALNRAPDASPLQATAPLDLTQEATRMALAQAVFGSDEYLNDLLNFPGGVKNPFQGQIPFGFFQAYLGRDADSAATQSYLAELKNGQPDVEIIAQILASDEYFARAASQPG